MGAAITPDTATGLVGRPGERAGTHRLVIVHAEHDEDDTLVAFARRVGAGDRVTLANLRPTSVCLPPPNAASDLGAGDIIDLRDTGTEYETRLDLRIAARSKLLRELGVEHDVVSESYEWAGPGPITARNIREAMGRIAGRTQADEIVVGRGSIVETERID